MTPPSQVNNAFVCHGVGILGFLKWIPLGAVSKQDNMQQEFLSVVITQTGCHHGHWQPGFLTSSSLTSSDTALASECALCRLDVTVVQEAL